jgi:hypothetical protein
MFITVVIPDGKALLITFFKKLPFTLSLLGSSANTNAGIPIVITLINDNCIGIKGYFKLINKNIIAIKNA